MPIGMDTESAYKGFMLAVNLHGLMAGKIETTDQWIDLLRQAKGDKGRVIKGIGPITLAPDLKETAEAILDYMAKDHS